MNWYTDNLDRWTEDNPPASPMKGRSCSTPYAEALKDVADMRRRIWNASKKNVARCRGCGARIVFLRRLDERSKKYRQTPVDIEKHIKGSARPWHRIFRKKLHTRHVCRPDR